MKKLNIILVILILLLSFTLIGNCWVAGYDQRIKLTIDNTKIDAGLSDFPVTAFFTVTQAEEIFAEFDADEDFDRGQFALEDDTLLYAEKELFDDSESLAIYHFKVTAVSSSEGTDIYFYYDNDAGHNTTYIGAINTVAGAAVWDSNFKMVQHMVNDNGNVDDSTSNNNDGTKVGAGEPAEVAGIIGQGQDFDGDDDLITVADSNSLDIANKITIETWINMAGWGQGDFGRILSKNERADYNFYVRDANDNIGCHFGGVAFSSDVDVISLGTDYHIAVTYNKDLGGGVEVKFFVNGVAKGTGSHSTAIPTSIEDLLIGDWPDGSKTFNGVQDELRLSDTNRTAAWLKGTYNSGKDILLAYGSEETSEVEPTYNYYGHFIK